MSDLTIVFPLYPGVTHLDFTGPHQVMSRIPGAKIIVASAGGVDIEADGLTFTGLADLSKVEACDVLCVPGGFGTSAAMLDEAFMAHIKRLAAGAKYLTSVCTGSLILAATGLLTGKRATCHWAWKDQLKPFGVIVTEGRVVRDGNVITGGGVTAGLDFAFTMVAELAGETLAQSIQLGLEYSPAPPFNAGSPDTAPPEILAAVRGMMSGAMASRQGAAEEAARRLEVGGP
ncbi:DJ-1/PfpI family protein [Phenylobacterium sp.]|uniref:DJ-1/PfpI family protein n=1 Tax=Phenylobacterium sp. TaxID=1871053 RepID=UPI00271D12DA|nr:DJ-1/PfpI family protein [Phenylobacterium sp.]MDO8378365.1 DJ-1/PfpI family protein [Phenylobacterium sp.]